MAAKKVGSSTSSGNAGAVYLIAALGKGRQTDRQADRQTDRQTDTFGLLPTKDHRQLTVE